MICMKHKIIFIHIPKTGGTSIRSLMKRQLGIIPDHLTNNEKDRGWFRGDKHFTAQMAMNELGEEEYKKYFKFGFVRNPWDRFVSNVNFTRFKFDRDSKKAKTYTFEEFLFQYPHYAASRSCSAITGGDFQFPFLLDRNNEPLVDFIGRFENYEEDLRTVIDMMGLKDRLKSIPHKYKSNRKSYQDYYTPEGIEEARWIWKRDIELFNYNFEELKGC